MDRTVNDILDRVARTDVKLFGKRWPAFQAAVLSGTLASAVFGAVLAMYLRLSVPMAAAIFLTGMMGFFGLTLFTKMVTGREVYVCHRNGLAVLAAGLTPPWLLGAPVLPYLDMTILAVGLGQAISRAGCLMVGCCHGRPYRWGICYGEGHAAEGFPRHYVGIRLFPIQAVEQLSVVLIVAVGTVLLLTDRPSGTAAACYLTSYAAVRFCLEFIRGDSDRPHFFGFSEAQWIALCLLGGMTLAGVCGAYAGWGWLMSVTACLVLAMSIVGACRVIDARGLFRLLHPRHVEELADAVAAISKHAESGCSDAQAKSRLDHIRTFRTSLGILMSGSKLHLPDGSVSVFAISHCDEIMDRKAASILARLIVQLRHHSGPAELVHGRGSVFHLVLRNARLDHPLIVDRPSGIDA